MHNPTENLDISSGGLLALAFCCVIWASLWAAAQSAFENLTNARAQDLVEEHRSGAIRVRKLVENREWIVTVCQTWRLTGQVLATAFAVISVIDWGVSSWVASLTGSFISGIVLMICSTLFAAPIGQSWPETTGLLLSRLVMAGQKILTPGKPLLNRLRFSDRQTEADLRSEIADDLREIVEEVAEDDQLVLEEEDRQILRSVFELGNTLVREVIVPRTEMVTVDTIQPVKEALEIFIRSGYSRLPVIGEDTDDIRGVVYLKDVVARLMHRPDLADHPIHEMMREAYFVPEMMPADDLLRKMQDEAPHIALVVDEWGGIVGLVTIEDVLEELVGEVTDEHDRAEPEPTQLGVDRWRIPAKLPLDDLGELFDLEIDDEDVDTAGGLLTKALGRVPLVGSEADAQGVHLKVESVDGRRRQMSWLEVTKLPAEAETE